MDVFFPMAGQGARFGYRFQPLLTLPDGTEIRALRAFLALGPVGTHIARAVRERALDRRQARESRLPRAG